MKGHAEAAEPQAPPKAALVSPHLGCTMPFPSRPSLPFHLLSFLTTAAANAAARTRCRGVRNGGGLLLRGKSVSSSPFPAPLSLEKSRRKDDTTQSPRLQSQFGSAACVCVFCRGRGPCLRHRRPYTWETEGRSPWARWTSRRGCVGREQSRLLFDTVSLEAQPWPRCPRALSVDNRVSRMAVTVRRWLGASTPMGSLQLHTHWRPTWPFPANSQAQGSCFQGIAPAPQPTGSPHSLVQARRAHVSWG